MTLNRFLHALAGAIVLTVGLPIHAISQSTAPDTSTFRVGRTEDGQPDLQGIWRNDIKVVSDHVPPGERRVYPFYGWKPIIMDPPDGKIPYQSWARSEVERMAGLAKDAKVLRDVDPQTLCVMNGPPRTTYQQGFQIFQDKGNVVFVYQASHQ